MKENKSAIKNKITPVRLHLELKCDYLSDYQDVLPLYCLPFIFGWLLVECSNA